MPARPPVIILETFFASIGVNRVDIQSTWFSPWPSLRLFFRALPFDHSYLFSLLFSSTHSMFFFIVRSTFHFSATPAK